MIPKKTFYVVFGLLAWIILSCKERKLQVRESRIEFGASEIKSAVERFRSTDRSAKDYAHFVDSLSMVSEQFNLETKRNADYWSLVLLQPILEKHMESSFEDQARQLAFTVWPSILNVSPDKKDAVFDYLLKLCSGKFAHRCNHLLPEAWSAVLSELVWQTFENRATDVIYECLDCDGSRNLDNLKKKISLGAAKIKKRVTEKIEEGSPTHWPVAFQGLDDLDHELELMSCSGEGVCETRSRLNVWEVGDQKAKKRGVALKISPQTTVGVVKKILRNLDTKVGKNTGKFLVFREKKIPYSAKQLKFDATKEIARNMRIDDSDSLQLWIQAKAAQN